MAETLREMMERIQKENDIYNNLHLPRTDLLGESMGIFLSYGDDRGGWSVKLGYSEHDIGHFCWVEDDDVKSENTLWMDYETPEEALQALDKQCREMRSRKVILVSGHQLFGEGYADDPLFIKDRIEME